ncbi:transposase [Salinimonas lutimaris]|uniref:transposase n=1 Tax=Salinimonas lutimaris TaxID=914153 RepID=UPI0010C0C493|nr:transposase [Salinimonas lutimaris]
MARKLRTSPAGIPQHLYRVARPDIVALPDAQDKQQYLQYLCQYARRYQVALHAWAMTDTQVQLLVTPATATGISSMFQATGRLYVQHYNQKYHHKGGIWQDRYKSSLILSDDFLLAVHQYIEQGCFASSGQADSLQSSALPGHEDSIQYITEHASMLALAETRQQRQQVWLARCVQSLPASMQQQIGQALKMGLALGDEHFIKRLESVIGRRLLAGKPGRPRKNAAATG